MKRMEPSAACEALIKRFEDGPGFVAGACTQLRAYRCPAGVWTIGWGCTEGVYAGMEITAAQADEMLRVEMERVAGELRAIVPPHVELAQEQFDALVSLCYNLAGGPPALPRKAPRLWKDLLAGQAPDAAAEFLDMDHALVNGQAVVLPGLLERRRAEAALFQEASI